MAEMARLNLRGIVQPAANNLHVLIGPTAASGGRSAAEDMEIVSNRIKGTQEGKEYEEHKETQGEPSTTKNRTATAAVVVSLAAGLDPKRGHFFQNCLTLRSLP